MNRSKLYIAAPLLGLAAMALRRGMYTLYTDVQGLLIPGNPLALLLPAVTLPAMVLLSLAREPELQAAPRLSAYSNWILALGLLLPQQRAACVAPLLWGIFQLTRYLSCAALVILGFFRAREKKDSLCLNAPIRCGAGCPRCRTMFFLCWRCFFWPPLPISRPRRRSPWAVLCGGSGLVSGAPLPASVPV